MNKIRLVLLTLVQVAISWQAFSQRIDNITTEFDGDRIIITYDLYPSKPDDKFNITLRSSHDNYERPIKFLMGDFGNNVLSGTRNRVIWDVKSELPPDFNGSITIKFEIETVVPFVPEAIIVEGRSALSAKPLNKNTFKRGSDLKVEWTGGSKDEIIKIELFKNNVYTSEIVKVGNTEKKYTWNIPKGFQNGEYYLRLSEEKGTEFTSTQLFKVKPRTPFLLKFLPIAALGAGAYFLLKPEPKEPDLPEPMGPPSN